MSSNKVISNFFWRFFERICAQLVTFVVSIILARLLCPEDYGAVAIIMIFITFANILVNNGFATALIQKKDADDLDFSSVFYFTLVFSILIYILIYFMAPSIAIWYGMPIISPTLRVLGIRIIIGAINSVQQSYVSRKMMFKKFFFSTIIGTIISALVGLFMAYSGMGIWALVMQYLVNTSIDTLILWYTVKWRPKKVFSFARLKNLLAYGWKLLVSALIGTLYDDLRTLIIGKIYSNEELAYYTRGQQFPKLIINNVNTSITSVIFPVLASFQDDKEKIALATRKSIQTSSGVIAPIMIGMAAVATPLVRVLLTDKWLPCVPFLQICCIYYLITSFYTTYLQVFKAIGRSGLSLLIELIDNIVGIILIVLFFRKGVIAIAIITLISRFCACIVCFILNKKILRIKYYQQLYDIGMPILIATIMFLAVNIVSCFKINTIADLTLQVFVGFFIYLILVVLFKLPVVNVVIGYLKKVLKKA